MSASRHARTGLWLCALYIVLYGGFVLIGAFRPDWMELTPAGGVNLAIWYGFGLIAAAIVLAVAYGIAAREDRGRADAPVASNTKEPQS